MCAPRVLGPDPPWIRRYARDQWAARVCPTEEHLQTVIFLVYPARIHQERGAGKKGMAGAGDDVVRLLNTAVASREPLEVGGGAGRPGGARCACTVAGA